MRLIHEIRDRLLCIGFLSALLGISGAAIAQRNCATSLRNSDALSRALISRDTVSIKAFIDSSIAYGHSNGWIESRAEICRDLYDGTLRYKEIRLLDSPTCVLQRRTAIIRHRVAVSIEMRDTKLDMALAVLQVWQFRRRHWVLIARQSCGIS